jgi:hypothetical protein
MGRTNAASRSWPSSRRRPPASPPSAPRYRPAPSGDGGPPDQPARPSPDAAVARQTVGIVWDVTTFWPRAAHPLAPPCYSERAVPHLVTRVSNAEAPREHLWLLTYGTQLNRLYGRAFPALFGPDELHKLAGSLVKDDTLRWRSLYRLSSPHATELCP